MHDLHVKREQEKKLVTQMITLYCHKRHKTGNILCEECTSLIAYANQKSDNCPFMETKTFCSNCKVHCYQPAMREKIRDVMRYSGPRMIFYHPITVIKHMFETKQEKKRLEAKK